MNNLWVNCLMLLLLASPAAVWAETAEAVNAAEAAPADPCLRYQGVDEDALEACQSGDVKAVATQTGRLVQETMGNNAAAQQNAVKPLFGGSSQLRSLDGTAAADARVGANNAEVPFLRLLLRPAPQTGDVDILALQDLDLSGTFERSYSVPQKASGVCANGIIVCDPGTWSNCLPQRWGTDEEGYLLLEAATMGDLQACFCVNSSCGVAYQNGQTAWNNLSPIRNAIAAGILEALRAFNPDLTLTRSEYFEIESVFYGYQDSTPEEHADGQARQQQGYASNPQNYESLGRSTWEAQQNQPAPIPRAQENWVMAAPVNNSPYEMFRSLSDRMGGEHDTPVCEVTRQADAITETRYCQDGEPASCLPGYTLNADQSRCCPVAAENCSGAYMRPRTVLGRSDKVYTYYMVDSGEDFYDGYHKLDTCFGFLEKYNWYPPGQSVDTVQVALAIPPGSLPLDPPMPEGARTLTHDPSRGCPHPGNHYRAYYNVMAWHVECKQTFDILQENIRNACSGLEVDSECQLRDEVVNRGGNNAGVQTMRDFNVTNVSPLPSSQEVTGEIAVYPIERPWWKKERAYVCQRDRAANFGLDAATGRLNTIAGSATTPPGGGTMTYSDYRTLDDGTVVQDEHTVGFLTLTPEEGCSPTCKARRPVPDTTVASSAVAVSNVPGQSVRSTIAGEGALRYEFAYYECTLDNVCPLAEGEEMVKDCQCLDEFVETIIALRAIELAGDDITCSGGLNSHDSQGDPL